MTSNERPAKTVEEHMTEEEEDEEEEDEEYLLIDLSHVMRKVPQNVSMWLEVSCLLLYSLALLLRKMS